MTATKQKKIPIHKFVIHGTELNCVLDSERHPFVNHGPHSNSKIANLVKTFPFLEEQDNYSTLAYLINFLERGLEYQFIENINQYKEQYTNRVEFEQNSFEYIPQRIIDHGIYDVTVMHAPRVIKDEFVFYVKEDHTGLPFCVRADFPIHSAQKVRYQLLPYAS
jgi:hypothetical protein